MPTMKMNTNPIKVELYTSAYLNPENKYRGYLKMRATRSWPSVGLDAYASYSANDHYVEFEPDWQVRRPYEGGIYYAVLIKLLEPDGWKNLFESLEEVELNTHFRPHPALISLGYTPRRLYTGSPRVLAGEYDLYVKPELWLPQEVIEKTETPDTAKKRVKAPPKKKRTKRTGAYPLTEKWNKRR